MALNELTTSVACPHYLPVDPSTAQAGVVYTCRGCGAPMTVQVGGGQGQDNIAAGYPGVPSNPSQDEVQ